MVSARDALSPSIRLSSRLLMMADSLCCCTCASERSFVFVSLDTRAAMKLSAVMPEECFGLWAGLPARVSNQNQPIPRLPSDLGPKAALHCVGIGWFLSDT